MSIRNLNTKYDRFFLLSDLKVDPALLQIGSSKTIGSYHNQKRKNGQSSENSFDPRLSSSNNNPNMLFNNRQSPPKNKTRYDIRINIKPITLNIIVNFN